MMLGIASASPEININKYKQQPGVYICESKSAYAYHPDRGCSGLNRCTHNIIVISIKEAKQRGYRACQKCY